MDVFRILGTGIRFNNKELDLPSISKIGAVSVPDDRVLPELDFFNDQPERNAKESTRNESRESNAQGKIYIQ